MSLTFRTSTCESHLHSENRDCKYVARIHCTYPVNEMEWDGFTLTTFAVDQPALDRSTLVCRICKVSLICLLTCGAISLMCLELLT
jgi:hypothetical protein